MRNDITVYDWTTAPKCFCQVSNQRRARRLNRILENQCGPVMTVSPSMVRKAMTKRIPESVKDAAVDLALYFGVFMAPLIVMGLLFGPVIP